MDQFEFEKTKRKKAYVVTNQKREYWFARKSEAKALLTKHREWKTAEIYVVSWKTDEYWHNKGWEWERL